MVEIRQSTTSGCYPHFPKISPFKLRTGSDLLDQSGPVFPVVLGPFLIQVQIAPFSPGDITLVAVATNHLFYNPCCPVEVFSSYEQKLKNAAGKYYNTHLFQNDGYQITSIFTNSNEKVLLAVISVTIYRTTWGIYGCGNIKGCPISPHIHM